MNGRSDFLKKIQKKKKIQKRASILTFLMGQIFSDCIGTKYALDRMAAYVVDPSQPSIIEFIIEFFISFTHSFNHNLQFLSFSCQFRFFKCRRFITIKFTVNPNHASPNSENNTNNTSNNNNIFFINNTIIHINITH